MPNIGPQKPKSKLRNYLVTSYDGDCHRIFVKCCKRVDITTYQSLFYPTSEPDKPIRLITELKSVNLEHGIITAYYKNESYITITLIKVDL